MVSFISIFCHVYLLTSLLEPTATLDVTYCLYLQLQNHYKNARTRMNTSKAAKLILSIMALSVQAFVLLGVLLMISLVELQQQLTQTQQHIKIAPSSSIVKEQTKNKDAPSSPLLLPTPPCEKEVPIPTKMMINGGDPPISDQDDAVVRPAKETKAMAAPNEPAPPLLPATPPDEAISKQQQTTTNDKDNVVNCSEQPVIENAAIELDRQGPLPDIQKPLSNTTMQRKSESNKNSNSTILESSSQPALTKNIPSFPSPKEIHEEMMVTTTTPSDMPVHSPNDSSLDLPPAKKPSKDDSTEAPAPTTKKQKREDIPSISSPTSLDSSPRPPSTTPNTEPSNDETTKATEQATVEEQEQNNVSPASLPLLSPSASLSSSLSTLNHATNNSTSPQEPSTTGSDGHVSRFHRSFIKKQQQQQQQKQPEELDPSSPFPISSHSSKTHVSNVSTTPKPLASSLSMKLNKLKQPGRRISQMFKKKKQPSS
ncbi:hypothetical protein [Absidia glauca]|uniref:Uncharacterized protein n=1 Tax=Absidia glauca TaxID=4829 RepID=A0A163LVN1_ABSGL|nr:hypothetical protein [Absidia glauca]